MPAGSPSLGAALAFSAESASVYNISSLGCGAPQVFGARHRAHQLLSRSTLLAWTKISLLYVVVMTTSRV